MTEAVIGTEGKFTMPATVAEVANEFLALGRAEPTVPYIDQMKLQKLLFYAHAWHLAFWKAPLFENDFEAWAWGPVVRDVYAQTRDCGRGPVTTQLWDFRKGATGFDVMVPDGVSENLKPFIKSVWESLKKYNGIQLSNSTHAPGEPWTIIAEAIGTDSKPNIPNELIADVFTKKLGKNATSNPSA